MKILHCPSDIGGQAWQLSRAERKLGYISDNMIFKSSHFNYSSDYNLNFKRGAYFSNFLKSFLFLIKAIKKYNVFHFYFGKSIFPFYLDLPILKIFRKKIFFTFQGCDIRRRRFWLANFKISGCAQCQDLRCQKRYWEIVSFFRLKIALLFANKTFVLNPDLKIFSPSSEILPYVSVDLEEWKPVKLKEKKDFITILHAPTDRAIKGTKYLVEAIKRLEKENFPIKLRLVEKAKHNQMKRICQEADIVVDQLLFGWYGAFAIEAMALGKPVICYLNKDFIRFFPWREDIPIVNASPINVYQRLKWLIENPKKREELGKQGREFVEKHHNSLKIAQKLVKIYQKP